MSEHCISRDVLTHLDLDNNQVEESKSVAHFDDRSAILACSENYRNMIPVTYGREMLELDSGTATKPKADLFLQPVFLN